MPLSKEDRQEVERVRGELDDLIDKYGYSLDPIDVLRTIGSIPSKDQSLPDVKGNEDYTLAYDIGYLRCQQDMKDRLKCINIEEYKEGESA